MGISNKEAWKHHNEIIAVIPKWDIKDIDALHMYADGVRAGWEMAGVINGNELQLMRNGLSEAVKSRMSR